MDCPSSREEVAARLNRARQEQHLSIRAVARLVDLPPATVQGWLSGRHAPTPALRPQFEQLVRALGLEGQLNPEWLDIDQALGTLRRAATPYVGLRPYAPDEEPLFFGRDREATRIAEVIARDAPEHGIVALVGPSGSGKSSLLAAGLIGRHCAPGGLLAPRRGVVLPVRDLTADATVPDADLVVLDQFEELLALGDDLEPTLARVTALAEGATVVLALRSDAYGRLAELPALRAPLERPVLVRPMEPDELREVITGPAALRGVRVDPGLVELVLTDSGVEADPRATLTLLPLVSHALLLTWGSGSGQRMTVADYVRAGGLASAVENLADGIVATLSPVQRRSARLLFMRMVGLLDDRPIRRPVALAALPPGALAVAQPFVDARVLGTTDTELVISHDAVLLHWPRLADWIEEGREQLRVREHLGRAARLWIDNDRAPDGLIPVDRLPLFAGLGAEGGADLLSPTEREFLTASRAHFTSQLIQERRTSARLRRRGRLATVLAAATLVLALLAGSAFLQARQVQREAQSRQVANQASTVRTSDTNLHAQLALAGTALSPTREAVSALLVSTGLDVPTRWTAPGSAFATVGPGGAVARADGDGRVGLWRDGGAHTGPDVEFRAGPAGGQLFGVALGRLGSKLLLVTGGAGGYRALWDVTGDPIPIADLGDAGTLFAAVFHPTLPCFVIAHSDGTTSVVEQWEVRHAGARQVSRAAFDGQVSAIALTPDGRRLFAAGAPDHLGAWTISADGLVPAAPVPLGVDAGVRALSLAVSPDGGHLAAGLTSGQVARWSLTPDAATPLDTTSVSTFWVNGVAWSGDGRRLLTGDSEQRLHVWDVDSMQHLRALRAPAIVQSVAWLGPEPLATLVDGSLLHWPEDSRLLRPDGHPLYYLAGDAEGTLLAATDRASARVELRETGPEAGPTRLVPLPPGLPTSVATAMAPSGDLLVAGTRDGRVVLWDTSTDTPGPPRVSRVAEDGNLVAIDVSADGSLLAAALYNSRSTVLARIGPDLTVTPLATVPTEVPQLVTFSPDGRYLQVGIAAGRVELWDIADPAHPRASGSVATSTNPGASAFAPVGTRLAAGTDDGSVHLWDWADPAHPREVRRLVGPRAGINSVAFSPDGSLLVAGGVGDYLWAWDLTEDDPNPDFSIDAAMGAVHDVQFIRGGRHLAVTGASGEVRVWGVDPAAARTELCAVRGAPLSAEEWERSLPGIAHFDPCAER